MKLAKARWRHIGDAPGLGKASGFTFGSPSGLMPTGRDRPAADLAAFSVSR
jgi:hypothetical protein